MDAVRDLLGDVPSVAIESVEYERRVGAAYGVDALIGLSYPGRSYALVVEVRSNGAPPLRPFGRLSARELRGAIAPIR